MPTDVHLDHAGGVGDLMRQLPEAQLVVHPFGSRHMIDPSKLQAGATAVYGEKKFAADFGELIAVPEERVLEAEDNFSVEINGRKLVCLDTPGHARHHYCVYDEQSNGFFSGDTFGISYREFDNDNGQFVFAPSTPVQFDPDAWHKTIDRLMGYSPKYMYLTHFGRIENLQPVADKLHSDLDAYVELCNSVTKENRYEQLKDGLQVLYLEQIKQHGCSLHQEQQKELLSLDLDINAQGLEVWMQRQEKAAG
jgi:glyoxylase-like metal-dependent hydrolase (beta-lactamase superfamily II)